MILNIQFWNGDKDQAMKLARLIADLQLVKRDDVSILFTARYDSTHDRDTIAYVSHKFPVHEYTCKRVAKGWPNGPNQMMGESYSHCVESVRSGKMKGDCVMFIESDCVPLSVDWLDKLIFEYRASGKMVSGAWLTKGDCNVEHVNGNMIMSLLFWKRCREIFNPNPKYGWDALFARQILPVAHPSRLIWSDYQLGLPHNPWRGCEYLWEPKRYQSTTNPLYGVDLQPVWFHGIKVSDGLDCARDILLKSKEIS